MTLGNVPTKAQAGAQAKAAYDISVDTTPAPTLDAPSMNAGVQSDMLRDSLRTDYAKRHGEALFD